MGPEDFLIPIIIVIIILIIATVIKVISTAIRNNRESKKIKVVTPQSLMSESDIRQIETGVLPEINQPEEIIFQKNELCHFYDNVFLVQKSNVATGYRNEGFTFIGKAWGSTLVAPSFGSKRIVREDQLHYISGWICITDHRIIFRSHVVGFDNDIDKLTAVSKTSNSVNIQFGSTVYNIQLNNSDSLYKAIRIAASPKA